MVLNAGAQEYDTYIIGGDTSEASDLIISVSLYGTANKSALMLRSGAKPGDILAVTGFFGKSAAGLRLLFGGCLASKNAKTLVDAVLMPKAKANWRVWRLVAAVWFQLRWIPATV